MKYEYKVSQIVCHDNKELEDILTSYGMERWELINVRDSKFIFKREKK